MMRPLDEAWVSRNLQPTPDPDWVLNEFGYNPLRESGVESRFSVSNGFLGVRGARSASRGATWVSWLHHLAWASWPRTYVAGLFDTPNTEPAVPALVPAPDWLRFRVILDGTPLLLRSGKLVTHHRALDMRRGLMTAEWDHRDASGRTVRLRSLRLVSLAQRHLGFQLVQFRVDEPVEVRFEAWLEMANAGLELLHVEPGLGLWRTAESGKRLTIASVAAFQADGSVVAESDQRQLTRTWSTDAAGGQTNTFWRLVSFARTTDATAVPAESAERLLAAAVSAGPSAIVMDHERAWADRWITSDLEVTGDPVAQRMLRFAVYHLNSAADPGDERVSIGARALTGDAYLGHVFWDTEIYLLPFYTLTWPAAARALLMYRYHTLPAARRKAARLGFKGALYAWESADTGDEATPDMVMGQDGAPVLVLCGVLEHHISADIAYAVWHYWQATRDEGFLLNAGAEILLETARFWASRATLEDDGHFHIRDVIGPDEYHEHVDDNAYTNVLAWWNLERGVEVAILLQARWPVAWRDLAARLHLNDQEIGSWPEIARRLVTGFNSDTNRIEQFAGYFDLEDIDLATFSGRSVPMDVVLGRERTQLSQVIKQADVVMLLALLPARYDRAAQQVNFHYYEPRCGHGSSLSRAMHAVVAARLGNADLALRYFHETGATDLEDTTAGAAGGVRIAAQGGLWQTVVFGFAGLTSTEDGLAVNPCLPDSWESLAFRVEWRGSRVHIRLEQQRRLTATLESGEPVQVHTGEQAHTLVAGEPWRTHWARLERAVRLGPAA